MHYRRPLLKQPLRAKMVALCGWCGAVLTMGNGGRGKSPKMIFEADGYRERKKAS
jgi:hypothetical protein